MATYVIGDIHGCKDTLDQLLALIEFGLDDNVWLVGDLVNRGPKSLDVLRWAMKLGDRVQTVLGNHELYLLARAADVVPRKKHCTVDQVLQAPDASDLLRWVRHRPLFVHNDRVAMVHAGLHLSWTVPESKELSLEIENVLQSNNWENAIKEVMRPVKRPGGSQLTESPLRWSPALTGGDRWRTIVGYFTRVRTCLADGSINSQFDGELGQVPRDSVPWFDLPTSNWRTHHILFGHWAALGLHRSPNATCVDSGCVWGRQLTAFRLNDFEVFSVDTLET